MKNNDSFTKQSRLLNQLSHLPKKILSLEGSENTPAFVLHELCNEQCFNLSKAAFFVDSPDFNYIKGVAGFNDQEAFKDAHGMWQNPHAFIDHLQQASFNQSVRNYSGHSIKRTEAGSEDLIASIAEKLGIQNPAFYTWDMKHDNHGFLIYEKNEARLQGIEEHLENSLYLLSFCPVF